MIYLNVYSATCVEETKSFLTSVVVGKDMFPRLASYLFIFSLILVYGLFNKFCFECFHLSGSI